jgi:hypothetical protein
MQKNQFDFGSHKSLLYPRSFNTAHSEHPIFCSTSHNFSERPFSTASTFKLTGEPKASEAPLLARPSGAQC